MIIIFVDFNVYCSFSVGYDGPLQYTMVHGNPDASTDIIHLSRSFSQDSDEIDGMRNLK